MTRYGLIAINLVVILTACYLVVNDRTSADSFGDVESQNSTEVLAPIDTVAAADIAANVAVATQLPIAVSVSNQADSVKITTTLAASDEAAIIKPQVIATGVSSLGAGDIITYKVKSGDTVSTLSAEFNIPSRSIRESNNLYSDQLTVGQTLLLPPRNRAGIVYKVQEGDTPANLASRFSASEQKIISFNDAEINGLKIGTYIFIPDGKKSAPAPISSSFLFANPIYGGNSYAPGNCTWYAASRVTVPSNWGNANTWDDNARSSGWNVSKTPTVGAIAESDHASYWGHVAIVEKVSADGMQVKYSDMNGIGGFGRVYFSDWVPVTYFDWYITK